MNGRERYFKTFNFKCGWYNGRVAEWSEVAVFSLEEVGVQVQFPAWPLPFFSLIVFLPFPFLLFILTAVDPVSFARFLRKRISSYDIQGTAYYLVWPK